MPETVLAERAHQVNTQANKNENIDNGYEQPRCMGGLSADQLAHHDEIQTRNQAFPARFTRLFKYFHQTDAEKDVRNYQKNKYRHDWNRIMMRP
jgi:hypothetical protein